jgi:hypothetical protein
MDKIISHLTLVLSILFFNIGLSQENDSHIVKSPTKELKMILYSNEKPVVEGNVVVVGDKLINHCMFVVYNSDGFVEQTIHYDMGKIIKITTFSEKEKI